jgi:hypothetical protein
VDHEGSLRAGLLEHRELTERVIGLAIEVHRIIGPGLLESVYTECLCLELERAGIAFESEVMVPVMYKTMDRWCKANCQGKWKRNHNKGENVIFELQYATLSKTNLLIAGLI